MLNIKNSILSHISQILSLILLLIIVRFTVVPFINSVQERITAEKNSIIEYLEEDVGLTLSYSSLSPIILDSIKLYDVNIHSPDKLNDIALASLSIKFSVWNIVKAYWLKVDPPSFIKSIYLKSGYVNLNLNDPWLYKTFSSGSGAAGNRILNFKVFIDNIDVSIFIGEDLTVECMESYGSIGGRDSRYFAEVKCDVNVSSPGFGVLAYVRSDADVSGYFSRDFKQIDVEGRLKALDTGFGRFRDLDVNFRKERDLLVVDTLNNKSDFGANYRAVFGTREHVFRFNLDNFLISDLVTPKQGITLFDPLKNNIISGEIDGIYNTIYRSFNFSGLGSAKITTLPIDVTANYNFVGDLDYITVRKLNLSSSKGYLGFSGGLDLKTMYPNGNFYVRGLELGANRVNSDFTVDVIDENFISAEFDFIEVGGVEISDISSVLYRDDRELSFQVLKKEGKGKVGISGTYSFSSKHLDSFVDIDNLKLDFLSPVIPEGPIYELISKSSIDLELDLKYFNDSVEYSINNLSLEDDGDEYLFLEARGVDTLFFVDYFRYISQDINIQGGLEGQYKDQELFLNLETLINENKYQFICNFWDNKINITGSYGLDCSVLLDESIYIDLFFKELPINFRDITAVSTVEARAALFEEGEFLLSVSDFSTVLSLPQLDFTPELSFKMDASNRELELYELEFNDNVSPLIGDITVDFDTDIDIDINLRDESENIVVNGSYGSNQLELMVDVEDFNLSRLQLDYLLGRTDLNLSFAGNLDKFDLIGAINSQNLTYNSQNGNISFNYSADEELITLTDFKSLLGKSYTNIPLLTYNYTKGNLLGNVNFDIDPEGLAFQSNMAIDFSLIPIESLLSRGYNPFIRVYGDLSILTLKQAEDELLRNKVFRMYHNSSALQIYSHDELFKLMYSYSTGLLNLISKDPYIMDLTATGVVQDGKMDVNVSDIDLDLGFLGQFVNNSPISEIVDVNGLDLHGELNLKGDVTNPLINGLMWVDSAVNIKSIKGGSSPIRVNLRIVDNKLTILGSNLTVGDSGSININGELLLDSYSPENMLINIEIPEDSKIPVEYEYGVIVIETEVFTPELSFYLDDAGALLTGDVYIEDGEFYTKLLGSDETEDSEVETEVKDTDSALEMDLNVIFSKGNRLYWPNKDVPIVDATMNPGDTLAIKLRSIARDYSVKGIVSIISGEVDYSGEPFILREGSVELDLAPDKFNPYIRLTATKTVLDNNERSVEVYLTFEGGLLSDFKPTFSSSDPTKSEDEIKELVGLAFTGSDLQLLLTDVIDESITSILTASLEESLEDSLGIDEVNIKSGFISSFLYDSIDALNITNNSFVEEEESGYNLSEMLNNTSITFGDFITDKFFIKGSLSTVYEDEELNLDMDLGFNLYTPYFQLGVDVTPKLSDDFVFEPELGLSLEWILTP